MKIATTCPPRVLVVEPDPVSRGLLVQWLRMAGYEAFQAETGERALLTLRTERERIEWLLTPIALPGLVDGWMLGDEFGAIHPGRPVLYAAGRDGARVADSHIVLNAPAMPAEVVAVLNRLSGRLMAGEARGSALTLSPDDSSGAKADADLLLELASPLFVPNQARLCA